MGPYMWIVIVAVFVGLISAFIVWFIRRHGRRSLGHARKSHAPLEPLSLSDTVVRRGSIDWQEIQQHRRFEELLSLEGSTMVGETFQLILSLAGKSQADILYARVGSMVQRVPAGQTGLAHIKHGEDARISPKGAVIEVSSLAGSTSAPDHLLGEAGFTLVVSFVNSLTEGSSFRYAARCDELKHRFIKPWDIPSAQSDEALLARVSSVADVAILAEKVRDIQTAASFAARHPGTLPLESGVCYILGEGGGRDLKFVAVSEVALLIVPAFRPEISLSEFLNNLTVKSQMHARIVLLDDVAALAAQTKDGRYELLRLGECNVLLGVEGTEYGKVDVVRIELDMSGKNAVTLTIHETPQFKNVLVWVLPTCVTPHLSGLDSN